MPPKRKPNSPDSKRDRKRLAQQARRANPEYREREREQERIRKQAKRTDPEFLEQERLSQQVRRSDPDFREKEREDDANARRARRENSEVRQIEQERDTAAHRARREDPAVRGNEAAAKKDQRQNISWEEAYRQFLEAVKEGAIHTCYSCDKLWFRKSIKITSKETILNRKNNKCTEEFLKNAILAEYYPKTEWNLCGTCHKAIVQGNVPRLNINFRNLQFFPIDPAIAALLPLERRLVSSRIPFMKVFALKNGQQFGIRGGIVNVPVDVPKMFNSIPINPNQANVITLKLKRKMMYKGDYMYERIRPSMVYKAAKVLCESPLYKNNDPPIKLNDTWGLRDIESIPFDTEMDVETAEQIEALLKAHSIQPSDSHIDVDDDLSSENVPMETDDLFEDPEIAAEELRHRDEETLIDNHQAVAFAPGEGQIPLPLWMDKNCEELAFPHIFGGHPRDIRKLGPNDRPLSYIEIVNSELLRTDRRAAEPDHLLYVTKKVQAKQLSDGLGIKMKIAKLDGNLTAKDARSEGFVTNAIKNDNAFRTLKNIVGSPAYWEEEKKNVMAMVRQFGICTFFVTLSAAETKWDDLIKILLKTVDGVDASDEFVKSLNWEKRAELIRKDPITCARYFDHRFKEVKKTWFTTNGPFGRYKIKHMYHRIEFQHRGSPHVHMIIWLEEVPTYDSNDPENFEEVADFIDSIVTTDSDDPEVQDFIAYQTHKCTDTCYKSLRAKAEKNCRFNAPFSPMKKTMVLTPLDDEVDCVEMEKLHMIVKNMKDLLNDKSKSDFVSTLTFEGLFEYLHCDETTYIRALRSSIKVNKVFIKRAVKDHRVNPYSKKILMCMQSNMDIQFILDPYACVNYIVEYINKPGRGLSRLLRTCAEDLRKGNSGLFNQLKSIHNTFYNSSEICAQEGAWLRCGLEMSKGSVVVEFINTNRIENRHRMLKPKSELEKLPENSEDIFKPGMIERYTRRPASMESICLADFIALYNFDGKKNEDESEAGDDNDVGNENRPVHGRKRPVIQLEDGKLRLRENPKVIRFVRFDFRKEPLEFFRERIMLFLPWRDQTSEVDVPNVETIFNQNKDLIMETASKYIKLDIDIDELVQQMEADALDIDPDYLNEYEPDENVQEPNVMFDAGRESATHIDAKKYSIPDEMPNDEFYELCSSLNEKQKDYLMHCLNEFKTSKEPIYHFVSGGAGVGKSRLITAIFQALIKFFRKDAGRAGKVEVALVAHTGKAAHNIGGETAHHFFSLKFGFGGKAEKYIPPSAEKLNTMQIELADLQVVIIDEISMLGYAELNSIHMTLNHVFHNTDPSRIFGGRSVIVFGDFNQLKPVKDSFCFVSPNQNLLNTISGNIIWEKFKMFELTEIMRQRDDAAFAQALNRLAVGESTEEDIDMFTSRMFTEETLPQDGKSAVRLAWSNKEIDVYNTQRMMQLRSNETRSVVSKALDSFPSGISATELRQIKTNLKGLPTTETHGLAETLLLQTGVKYMITSNVDVSDGLFNGAIGFLRDFVVSSDNQVTKVYLEFDDETVGKKARQTSRHANKLLTPLVPVKASFAVTRKYTNTVTRKQFPLVVAEGITIHKSQGSTFQKVTVQIPDRNIRSLIYVALSRATKLENLFLLSKKTKSFPKTNAPAINDPVVKEMKRLREEAVLVPKFRTLRNIPENSIQIVSHNVQSLMSKVDILRRDPVFANSSLILLQESWLGAQSDISKVEIPDKSIVARNMLRYNAKRGHSTMIYSSENVSNVSYVDRTAFVKIDLTSCQFKDILVINIYRSEGASVGQLISTLKELKDKIMESSNVVMLGDFNTAISKETDITRICLEQHYGLKYLQPAIATPTTNNYTTIDGVFGKFNDYYFETHVYESFWSYHKPIVLRLTPKNVSRSTGLSQTLNVLNV